MASSPSPQSAHGDENDLADSAFEIITRVSSENGSLDDRVDSMSEDLSEYERYPHPDEVRAFGVLDDMSNSTTSVATDSEAATDEDEEQQEDSIHTNPFLPSYQDAHAHDFLQDPLEDTSVATIFAPNSTAKSSNNSIEFSEPEDIDVHIDKISVKHTIKEFTQDEAVDFFELAGLGQAPQRVSATVRQTMSQRCLSTHEAFRVLYVGDEKYKGEIILKLSRAITCSSSVDYNENKTLCRNTEGVYNIVPVPFGTVKDRDVELMEASGFQIKVDTCLDAEKKSIGSKYFSGDIIYSLTVDGGNGGKKYSSVPAPGPEGVRVQPAWSLPHVAVFCVSEDDDDDMHRLQHTAFEFCERHAIPTLFISDQPVYAASIMAACWENYNHEHAVCLSLESRDWKTERRFPIDLNSFINIDNRQMNQNLAYLTGLQEPVSVADEKMRDVISLDGSEQDLPSSKCDAWMYDRVLTWLSGVPRGTNGVDVKTRRRIDYLLQRFFGVIGILSLVLLGTHLSRALLMHLSGFTGPETDAPAAVPSLTTSAGVATVTINYTSTKTVVMTSVESSSFGGLLSDIAHTVSADWPKNTVCSAELYGNSEVLIKLPSGTKETWLAKGAIDVDVSRGETPIPSRLSSSTEGIIIQIPGEEAHGVLNVSVITTRKPKINETFAVDFGSRTPLLSEVWSITQSALQKSTKQVGYFANGVYRMIENSHSRIVPPTEAVVQEKSQALRAKINSARDAVQSYSSQVTDEVLNKVKTSILPEAGAFVKSAQQMVADRQRHMDDIRQNGELAILKAQIQSKLWWLKVQGKEKAYQEYENKARIFMSKKYVNISKMKDQAKGPWKV
ncbi:hypothetical protein N0V82_000256 [Gnomoniopsis sp. IMI 355080]|nr:hypothetical protein N0V82_000256 [Gnomoniopsis sp. IMI 355080]